MTEHEIGNVVRYGAYGECKILDRREEFLGGSLREFYILTQTKNTSSTIYVPVEKADALQEVKRALTVDEIKALYSKPDAEIDWNEDEKKRDARFKQAFSRADTEEIACILKAILSKQEELKATKKKLRSVDLNAIKICEKILFDELSRSLELRPEDVIPIIVNGEEPKAKIQV